MDTFFGSVIGFRAWHLDSNTDGLVGPISKVEWPTEEPIRSVCEPPVTRTGQPITESHEHPIPHHDDAPYFDCDCGIYAWNSLNGEVWSYAAQPYAAIGAIVAWGRIQVHTGGFRAQNARVVALANPHLGSRAPGIGYSALINRVALRYHVPVVPAGELDYAAEPYGQPLGQDFGIY